MSEKRFTTKNIICSNYCVWDNNDKPYGNDEVVDLLNELSDENEQLKAKVKRLQDIATRTEAEKEEYADLYCKCENELIKNSRRCDDV